MTRSSRTGAAIAIVQVYAPSGAELDRALRILGLDALEPGAVALRTLPGGDRGLVARWSAAHAQLFPHGGAQVIRSLAAALESCGLPLSEPMHSDPLALFPEADDLVEACALDAIAAAASPRAIPILLSQRARWRRPETSLEPAADHDQVLDRLLSPPLVMLVGPPNVGKSTLTNALARRSVSITSEEPGATRDHVGVLLELDGLVVRWVDSPGFRAAPDSAIEVEAIRIARALAERADLVLIARDQTERRWNCDLQSEGMSLEIGLKADLGEVDGCDLCVSAHAGTRLVELARQVRSSLVSDSALDARRRWRFHEALHRSAT